MRFDKAAVAALALALLVPSAALAQRAEDPMLEDYSPRESGQLDFIGMVGASAQKAALAGSMGARLRFAADWHVGLHAEINPFTSVTTGKLRSGSANLFASIDYRWIQAGRIVLTTAGYAGVSWLLFDLYGVPQGSLGPYVALTPLATEIRFSVRTALIIEPVRIAAPIPKVTGVPFGYPQYRFSLGIAIGLD